MRNAKNASATATELTVWDTQYWSPSEAYTNFLDAMRSDALPWTPKEIQRANFRARMETITLERGGLGRLKCVAGELIRTQSDIAHSSIECFCALYILSGSAILEQGGITNVANQGDVLFFDSAQPAKLTSLASGHSPEVLGIVFPKSVSNFDAATQRVFVNTHYPRERILSPLTSTLSHMSNRLASASYGELNGLFEATIALIAADFKTLSGEQENVRRLKDSASLRAVLSFIEHHLPKSALSAAHTARALRISERYVHKMFACAGTTFSAYVTGQRLERIRADLISPISQSTPISTIAYKWGFNDLSTFNRSFKKRFGCTPRALRA